MNYPKLFVINLKRSVDRKKHMEKVCSELPMKFEFVEAVDSNALSEEEILQVYDEEACKSDINRSLSKPEIACFLSHIKTWKLIQEQSLQSAFVMEDDIVIKNQNAFLEILKKQPKFPKDWELILFAHGNSRIKKKGNETSILYRKKIYKNYKIARFLEKGWGTLSYFIHSRGIFKLLKKTKRIQGTIDDCYIGNDQIVNLYGIEPVVIEEDEYFGNNSFIEKTREKLQLQIESKPKPTYIPTKMDKVIDGIELILNFLKILKIIKFFYHIILYKISKLKRSLKLKKYKRTTYNKLIIK